MSFNSNPNEGFRPMETATAESYDERAAVFLATEKARRDEAAEHQARIEEIEALLAEISKEEMIADFEERRETYSKIGEAVVKGATKTAEAVAEGTLKAGKAGRTAAAVVAGSAILSAPVFYHNPIKHGHPGEGASGGHANKGAQTEQTIGQTSKKNEKVKKTSAVTADSVSQSPHIDTSKTISYVPSAQNQKDTIPGLSTSSLINFNIPTSQDNVAPRPVEPLTIQTPAETPTAKTPAMTDTERKGPEILSTGFPDQPFNPAPIPPVKRGRITVKQDTTAAVPSTGIPVEWSLPGIPKNPPAATPTNTPAENKTAPTRIVPASPEHPDPEILDPKIFESGTIINPADNAEDDSTEMEINQYDRIQDSSRPNILTIIHPGAEHFAKDTAEWTGGHSSFKLESVTPGYELQRVHGFPDQDEIDAFAAPSGREIKMPDPEMKRTSTGLLIPRKLYENLDPKLFTAFEPDPVNFEIYEHNQVQSKSIGSYVMESKGVMHVIGKDGMLLFDIKPEKGSEENLGRSFVRLVKGKGDSVGHLELNGKPLNVSKMEMEQLIKNCVQSGGGEKGFYLYGMPDNSEAYKNGKTRETVVKHINRFSGDVEEITLGKLHDEEQNVLTAWHMNPNHFVRYYKKTQEYHATNGEYATFEEIEREKSAHMRRKIKTIVEKTHAKPTGPKESDFKPTKKTERAPNRAGKVKK